MLFPGVYSRKIVNDPDSPLTKVNVTALGAVLADSVVFPDINLSIDTTVVGPGGLDVGPAAINRTYYFYLISDGTNVAAMASLSPDSPTLPSGFTYCCRIAAWATGGAGNWFRMITHGKRTSALMHMSGFTGRFSMLDIVGDYVAQKYKACLFTGVPLTADYVFGHALITGGNNLMLVAADPLASTTNFVAVLEYSGGSKNLSLRLYYECPVAIPQTLFILNSQAGAGVVVQGWIDSANVT